MSNEQGWEGEGWEVYRRRLWGRSPGEKRVEGGLYKKVWKERGFV